MAKRLIAIDPSEWGTKTSGTGFAWCNFDLPQINQVKHAVVFGKEHQSQADYNLGVLEFLNTCLSFQDENLILIEEYVNFNKGAHQFKVNGTSEMIGVLKQHCLNLGIPVIMRNSSQIKGLTKMILEHQQLLKDNQLPLTLTYNSGKLRTLEWNDVPEAKHDFDAYRHLILLIRMEIKENESRK